MRRLINVMPPARKHTKIESSLNHPHLVDPNHLLIWEPKDKTSLSLDVHTVVYDSSFQHFFETRFPAIYTDGVEHQLNLDNFSFWVHWHEMDYAGTNESSSRFQVTNLEIVDKTVYHYCEHLYYLGFRILPIFQCPSLTLNHLFQVDEILPFLGSDNVWEVNPPYGRVLNCVVGYTLRHEEVYFVTCTSVAGQMDDKWWLGLQIEQRSWLHLTDRYMFWLVMPGE